MTAKPAPPPSQFVVVGARIPFVKPANPITPAAVPLFERKAFNPQQKPGKVKR